MLTDRETQAIVYAFLGQLRCRFEDAMRMPEAERRREVDGVITNLGEWLCELVGVADRSVKSINVERVEILRRVIRFDE